MRRTRTTHRRIAEPRARRSAALPEPVEQDAPRRRSDDVPRAL